jgi:hypothetical protein
MPMRKTLVVFVALASPLFWGSCGREERPSPQADIGSMIYLAQAQFVSEKGADGKTHAVPGAARLIIYHKTETGWVEEVLEDPESNVFHKAIWWAPSSGEPGILTIGATRAFLKIWRKGENGWTSESLWNPTFGGNFDRLRDFEVADLSGDGSEDVVLATHDQGVVAVISLVDGTVRAEELCRSKDTFVHEIEVGDVDGDGDLEIFATPSQPNKLDGSIQPGRIDMWDYWDGHWTQRRVDVLKTRHAKEILCVTLTGEDRPILIASLEGERPGGAEPGDSTRIRVYRFEGDEIVSTDVASLPGQLCRFLTHGDTDGDGTKELIASTKDNGIWKIVPVPGKSAAVWRKELIAEETSGFEHATYLDDLNGDGIDEIYVASDDQGEFRCYWFNGKGYSHEVIGAFSDEPITFNVSAHRPGV